MVGRESIHASHTNNRSKEKIVQSIIIINNSIQRGVTSSFHQQQQLLIIRRSPTHPNNSIVIRSQESSQLQQTTIWWVLRCLPVIPKNRDNLPIIETCLLPNIPKIRWIRRILPPLSYNSKHFWREFNRVLPSIRQVQNQEELSKMKKIFEFKDSHPRHISQIRIRHQ